MTKAKEIEDIQHGLEEVIKDLIFYKDVTVPLSIELGRSKVNIRTLLDLEPGSIIELGKSAGETLDVYASNYKIMRAEITVIEDSFALRITEIVNPWKKV
ncbi:MAG: hypothetical protein CSA81_04025 [Acidobacteria bacterium]|nr:MAG: hypothetical protein CSA81_04025 [Acidobacteriota bacterium]PIE90458.1 MAG: hypothetical protein CR997_05810 [Acidobacteriota bacterium]